MVDSEPQISLNSLHSGQCCSVTHTSLHCVNYNWVIFRMNLSHHQQRRYFFSQYFPLHLMSILILFSPTLMHTHFLISFTCSECWMSSRKSNETEERAEHYTLTWADLCTVHNRQCNGGFHDYIHGLLFQCFTEGEDRQSEGWEFVNHWLPSRFCLKLPGHIPAVRQC